ncbi:putative secreted protein (Por secretion system target) [Flavobacterium sp. 9]|uniref:chondroitinase family polysaccharide lyase n=1 Tax=Flavobacterium sp. 9 TaxID=2035198 RepID=UPI000C18D983|nr:chondroitinase family polysaccharide lyase [Flavobacterium sp. 9]PIF34431.1 putative secreted protein (Por secretion system target) [Flavobacterium sp. 9]
MCKKLLFSAWLIALVFNFSYAQLSDISNIKTKYQNWLTGENLDYSNSQANERYSRFLTNGIAAKNLSAYDFANPGSVWNFSVSADQNAYQVLVEQKLIRLVFLYQLKGSLTNPNPDYHSPALRDSILSLFNYMKAKGISSTTDFAYLAIPATEEVITSGHGICLRSSGYATAIFLMKDELIAAGEFNHHMGALKTLTAFISPDYTGFNFTNPGFNTDIIRSSIQQRLCYILAQEDSDTTKVANMDFLKRFINNALKISNGWNDCIKPDFITYHHRGAYSNSYGVDALHQSSIMNMMLKNTVYELSTEAQSNLKNAILSYSKFSKGFEMPLGLAGRFPTNTDANNDLRPALAFLYLTDPVANADAGREFLRLWNISATANTNLLRQNALSITMVYTPGAVMDMIQTLNSGLTALPEITEGHFNFPYAGLSVHKYNGYQISAKGTSKNIWHFENSTTENVFGRYTSAGALELLTSGTTNGFTENGWDWSHVPGTTVAYLPLNVLSTGKMREMNGKSFLTHASLDNNGVFGIDYKDYNSATAMTALKSNFFFKDMILCLGSNIRDTNGTYPIQTTLFQTNLTDVNTPTYVNGNTATGTSFNFTQTGGGFWATDAIGNGYVIPANSSNTDAITINRSVQNSRNNSNTANTTGNFTTAYINHGIAPAQAKFQYAIVMQGGQTATQQLANNFSSYFKIYHQNSQAHIVEYIPESIFGYVIFNPAAVFTYDVVISVNKPAAIMTQKIDGGNKLKVSLTNPNLGLLASNETYTWNQISGQNSILNRAPQVEIVTLTIVGKWALASPSNNVTTTINGANTEVTFKTINGLTIQTELIKPSLAINPKENITVNTNPGVCTYTVANNEFDATATSNCGTSSLTYTLSGATIATGNTTLQNVVFNKGITTVIWKATDDCNSSTTTFTVTVKDEEKPVITTPIEIIVSNDSGECSKTLTLTNPIVTDNCGIASITNDAPAIFPVGSTIVNWKAEDENGNINTITQTITITDSEAPTVSTTASVSLCYDPNGIYNIPLATATDNCTINTIVYEITGATTRTGNRLDASGNFNTGTSTITWTVTDNAGNSKTNTTIVTINNLITANIANVYAVNPGGNPNTIYLGYGPSSLTLIATASNGIAPYTYSWNDGATSQNTTVNPSTVGTHNYTVTITDALGCYITLTKQITVIDVRCSGKKITICHTNDKSLCISTNAVASHLAHGCYLGSCHYTDTGNSSPIKDFTVIVAPNPTKTAFHLNINGGDNTQEIVVTIFDILGRRLKTLKSDYEQTISIGTDLCPGLYLAEISQGYNKKTVKLIKL